MNIYIGSLLIVLGLTIFAWSIQEYRRPAPPLWASRENYAIAFSVSVPVLLALGIAANVHIFLTGIHESLGTVEWTGLAGIYGVLAAALVLLFFRWRRISQVTATRPAFTHTIVYPGSEDDPAPENNFKRPKAA